MNIVRRETEAQILRELLKDAINGEGNVAVVSGAAGMGKSSLLAALADEAAECGAVVLAASCSRGETELPFAVIGQLMRTRSGGATQRNPWRRALVSVADGERPGDLRDLYANGAIGGSSVAMSVCTALLELAERCPVVLVVDDVQFADQHSARCLSYLVRRVKPSRVLAVFSQQEIAWHPPTALQAELTRQPRCHLLRLAPLTETEVAQMIGTGLGEDAATRLASRWHQVSGGNPSLLQALVADYPEPGPAYSLAILSCLGQEPALRQLAAGLAVLGDDTASISNMVVGRLTRIDADMLESGLRSLRHIGVIGQDRRFRHPLARSTILASLDPELRAELHERAAEIAFGSGLPAEHVADHLRAAALSRSGTAGGSGGSSPWAVPVLEQAARAAIDSGRIEAAVDYLKLAEEACTDDQHRTAIRTTLVRAEWRIDPAIPAAVLTELVADLEHGNISGPDLVVLAKALLWHGRGEDARTVLAHLGRSADDAEDPAAARTAAEISALLPWLRCTYPPMLAHCPPARHDGSVPPTATTLHRQEAAAALVAVLTEGPAARIMPALEPILRYSRLDDMSMDAEECALLALVFSGQLDQAAYWSEAFTSQAVSRNATNRQARLAAIRAEIGVRQGDLAAAARFGQLALSLMPAAGWGVAIGAPLSAQVLALTAMGELDSAAELIRRPVPEAMLETRHGLQYLHARGQHQLAVGNAEAALADFLKAGELMRAWQLDAPVLVSWRLAAAEALLRTGQQERARELIEEQMSCQERMSGREHGSAMRLLAAVSELSARPSLLSEAAEVLQEAGDRYELSRALAALAVACQKSGEARRARTTRKRALTLAMECQAEPLVRQLSGVAEITCKGEPSMLSETERRVAELATIGYSNRDISDKLFITVSTVEQHLTRIYRKLGLNGRAELTVNHVPPRPGLSARD